MSKITEQYNKVFENEKIKNCGRIECIKLIEMFEKIYPNVDFGNKRTGFININNINKYYKIHLKEE